MALAAVEQRWVVPPAIHPSGEAPPDVVTSTSAIEALGYVMQASSQTRESFAARLNELNSAALLADSLAAEGVAAAAASAELDKSGSSADGPATVSAASVVEAMRQEEAQTRERTGSNVERTTSSGGRRTSFSLGSGKEQPQGRERKRSVWRDVAKKVPGTKGAEKKHAVLKELDELSIEVEKATEEYEEALALKLDFSLEADATESSEEATVCRRTKKRLDTLRIKYVRQLERLNTEKEAELLDRTADTFFSQREAVAALLAAMDNAKPRFDAIRASAGAVREEAAEMESRRQRMAQAVDAKEVKRKKIRDLTKVTQSKPKTTGRKRSATSVQPGKTTSKPRSGTGIKLGDLPVIPSEDHGSGAQSLRASTSNDADQSPPASPEATIEDDEDDEEYEEGDSGLSVDMSDTTIGGDPAFEDGKPGLSPQLTKLQTTSEVPASPEVRRETVIFGKAGFVFADSPELAPKLGAIEALQTPRIRERKRWVRTWCKLGTEGTIELQRLPAPSNGSALTEGTTPPKGGRGTTSVTIPLSRCELILPQFEQLVRSHSTSQATPSTLLLRALVCRSDSNANRCLVPFRYSIAHHHQQVWIGWIDFIRFICVPSSQKPEATSVYFPTAARSALASTDRGAWVDCLPSGLGDAHWQDACALPRCSEVHDAWRQVAQLRAGRNH